jgi:hypothetical protein
MMERLALHAPMMERLALHARLMEREPLGERRHRAVVTRLLSPE